MTEKLDSTPVCASPAQSPHHIHFSGLEVLRDSRAVQVYFELSDDGEPLSQDISFVVNDDGSGSDALIAKGYDALIAALQQMAEEATAQREGYRRMMSRTR